MKYYEWKQNVVLISILVLAISKAYDDSVEMWSLIFYIFSLFVFGNVSRIYFAKKKGVARLLRRLCMVIPFYLVLPFVHSFYFDIYVLKICFMSITYPLVSFLIYRRSWRICFLPEMIRKQTGEGYNNCITKILYLLFTAAGEEIFFRGLFIGECKHQIIMIFVSAICFITVHVTNYSQRSVQILDLVNEGVFSIFAGVLFVITQSCIPCIIAHELYDLPYICLEVKKLWYQYKGRERAIYER